MAGRDVVAELAVNLTLESASFASGASVAEKRAKTLEGRMGALGNRATAVGGALKGLAGGFIAGIGVAGITSAISSGLEYASSLGEVAQQLGVTTDELQKYRYAASQVGIEQAEMDKGLAFLSRTLGDLAGGAKAPAAALTKLGFSTAEIAKISKMSAGTAIPVLADAFAKLKSPTEQAALAADLFGAKLGGKFLTLLTGGSAGINELTGAATKLGLVLTPEQIAKADEAADKFTALKTVLSAKIAGIVADNAGAIIKFVDAASSLTTEGVTAVQGYFDKVRQNFQEISGKWDGYSNEVEKAVGEVDALLGKPAPTQYTDTGTKAAINLFTEWNKGSKSLQESLGMADAKINTWATNFNNAMLRAQRSMAGFYADVKTYLGGALDGYFDRVKREFSEVGDAAFDMWTRVTRRSYVPDMMDDISREFDRLNPEMTAKADKSTKAVSEKFKALRDDVRSLMSELFPEEQAFRDYQAKLGTIAGEEKAGRFTPQFADEARRRLAMGGLEDAPLDVLGSANESLVDFDHNLEDLLPKLGGLGEQAMTLSEKWGTAISAITNIIGGLFGDSKFGRIAGAVLEGGLQIAGAFGAFGGKRARGGPVVPGKTYLVGENGPEYVTPNRRGYVHPNGSGSAPSRVQIVPSPYFDAVVDGRAAGVAAPMAARAAMVGASGGVGAMGRRQRRAIP